MFNLGINYKFLIAAVVLFASMALIVLFFESGFIRYHFGDILVVMFIYCAVRAIVRRRLRWLCLGVFIFATLVEIGQYFNLVERLGLGGNRLAEIVIGTTFDPMDIVMYAVGCILMYVFEIFERSRRV